MNEASDEDDDFNNFSDESNEKEYSEDGSDLFIDEEMSDREQNLSFYRSLENNAERVTFFNQKQLLTQTILMESILVMIINQNFLIQKMLKMLNLIHLKMTKIYL